MNVRTFFTLLNICFKVIIIHAGNTGVNIITLKARRLALLTYVISVVKKITLIAGCACIILALIATWITLQANLVDQI